MTLSVGDNSAATAFRMSKKTYSVSKETYSVSKETYQL